MNIHLKQSERAEIILAYNTYAYFVSNSLNCCKWSKQGIGIIGDWK
jgi:hypothetical protein